MNKAYEAGLKRFPWWPQWDGEAVAIVASGPSCKAMQPEQLKDRIHVIAIKENTDLCPWAEVVYGCDGHWWQYRKGLPERKALKITYDQHVAKQFNILRVDIQRNSNEILVDEPMVIGSGGNSGFQAINLAVQFGAKDIILLGFDMNDEKNPHWYGRNTWDRSANPMQSNFNHWLGAYRKAAPKLKERGINVVNVSPVSKLDVFEKRISLGETLEEWGL